MAKQRFLDEEIFLNDEEREISEAIDKAIDEGTLVDHLTPERKAEIEQWARNTLEDRRQAVTADISGLDYSLLGERAKELGITPEDLLSQIVHDYVEGRLVKTK